MDPEELHIRRLFLAREPGLGIEHTHFPLGDLPPVGLLLLLILLGAFLPLNFPRLLFINAEGVLGGEVVVSQSLDRLPFCLLLLLQSRTLIAEAIEVLEAICSGALVLTRGIYPE